MAPSSFRVSEPGRGQPTADPGGGGIDGGGGGGGRNPGGTARWYSPAGAGTRHLTRGGGSNHLHLLRGKGQNPLEESLLALHSAMASAPLCLCLTRAQPPPLRPRSGSHAQPAARTSPPLPALVGPGPQLGARRAPAAAVGRALGVRRAVAGCRGLGVAQLGPQGRAGIAPAAWRAPSGWAPCFVL